MNMYLDGPHDGIAIGGSCGRKLRVDFDGISIWPLGIDLDGVKDGMAHGSQLG